MLYSQEQIDRANRVDLVSFLRSQGESLIHSGKEYRWKKHDSITVYENKWYRHSRSKGGHPIDFVMEFWGKTFPEAVEMLIGENGNESKTVVSDRAESKRSGDPDEGSQKSCPIPSPDFHLPVRNITDVNVKNYLMKERGLDENLIQLFVDEGSIYEDEKCHNVVFIGRDSEGVPRYAHCRGTAEKFRQDVAGSDKAYGFSYQGKDNQLFVFEAPIDMLSFINLFPKNWQDRNYVSLGGVAAKAMEHFLSEHPEIDHIFLCLDADQAGDDACLRLTELLSEDKAVYRLMPVRKDWNEVLLHKEEIENNHYLETLVLREPEEEVPVPMFRISDVESSKVEWLWEPYIPFGKITILQGDPGIGKTFIAMQIAAACTNRVALPNMTPLEPFNVIYQTAEDGLGDTVKPRLESAGADLEHVWVIDDTEEPLTLTDDRLEKAIVQKNARLVIIDPVQAFLGVDMDMNRATDVRFVFKKLGYVAMRTGCAILLIGHLNKCQGMSSSYRGLGSVDFRAAARSVLVVGCKKDDRTFRALAHDKSSLGPTGVSLAYVLGDEDGFRWIGSCEVTPDELLSGVEPKKETKTAQAKKIITEMLAGGKTALCSEIDEAAMKAGIASRTVRDAKKELGDKLKSKRGEGGKTIFWME